MSHDTRKLKFKAETRKVLDIVINSLYSHPDVFLRELISNASDALDRLRFKMLTSPELDGDREFRIEVIPDVVNGTLTVRDNGIGMDGDEMTRELGTIAGSGTRNFLKKLQKAGEEGVPELIGQFGVGFYSGFMVADRIRVLSRPVGGDTGYVWESTGQDTFTLKEEKDLPEGTDVVLYLKGNMKEYLDPVRLAGIVRRYSDFISYPVYVKSGEDDKWKNEPVNSMKPIWTKPEEEVTDREYDEFYMRLSFDLQKPLSRLVFHGEGTTEFHALLYIPASRTVEMLLPDYKTGIRLFVRKVMIEEEADELLPRYLRFIRGVVESSDLPLNISRETLQENRIIRVIRNALTGKVISRLEEMLSNDRAKYEKFFDAFGELIKEGIYSDEKNRDRLADLLLVWTSRSGDGRKTLKEVVDGIPGESGRLYYVTGNDRKELASSPYIESAGSGREVILFDSPMDEFMLRVLGEYGGRKLVSLMKELGDEDLTEAEKAERKHAGETYAGLLEFMKDVLGERVEAVRFSPRLRDVPCILVNDRDDPGEMFRNVLKTLDHEVPKAKRILELNPAHPVLDRLQELYLEDRSGGELENRVMILFDLGTVMAGGRPENPSEFGKRVASLLS